jgi:hypothetical protein
MVGSHTVKRRRMGQSRPGNPWILMSMSMQGNEAPSHKVSTPESAQGFVRTSQNASVIMAATVEARITHL